ncbi:hypothetical protein FKM82_018147 [Ascaphus truei]
MSSLRKRSRMGVPPKMAALPVPVRTSFPVATAEQTGKMQQRFGDRVKVPDHLKGPRAGWETRRRMRVSYPPWSSPWTAGNGS